MRETVASAGHGDCQGGGRAAAGRHRVQRRRGAGGVAGVLQVAAASTAIGQSAKDHAHHTHAAAVQAATAAMAGSTGPGGSGPDSHALAATASATDAYFSYLGFVYGAYHIGYCVQGITAAIACGLGLTGWPPGEGEHGEPGANQRPPASGGPGT